MDYPLRRGEKLFRQGLSQIGHWIVQWIIQIPIEFGPCTLSNMSADTDRPTTTGYQQSRNILNQNITYKADGGEGEDAHYK